MSNVITPLWGLGLLRGASSCMPVTSRESSRCEGIPVWKEESVAWVLLKLMPFIPSGFSSNLLSCTFETDDLSFLESLGKLWLTSSDEFICGVRPMAWARSILPFLFTFNQYKCVIFVTIDHIYVNFSLTEEYPKGSPYIAYPSLKIKRECNP